MENVNTPIDLIPGNSQVEAWNVTATYYASVALVTGAPAGGIYTFANNAFWSRDIKVTGTDSSNDYGLFASPNDQTWTFKHNAYKSIGADTMNFRCCASNVLREFAAWQNQSSGDDSYDTTGSFVADDFVLSVTLTDPLDRLTSTPPIDPSWAYPQSGSPLRNAGTEPPAWAKDFYGRAFVAPYDIGAVDSSYGVPAVLGSSVTPDPPITRNHMGGGSPATGGIW